MHLLSFTFLIIYLIVDSLLYNGPCMFFVMIYVLYGTVQYLRELLGS